MGKKSSGKAQVASGEKTSAGSKGPKPATHVKVRHILCEKQGKILEALAKIQAGEQFSAVAGACSEDKARQGGDLGWKTRSDVVPEFGNAAFQLAVGEMTSAPVKTAFGYHLIMCEGRK